MKKEKEKEKKKKRTKALDMVDRKIIDGEM